VSIRIQLTGEDLARVRFGMSPVFETVAALKVLENPGRYAIHLPWIRWAQPRLAGLPGYPLIRRLLSDHTIPASLVPPPDSRLPDFTRELRRVRQADPARVRESLTRIFGHPAWVRPLIEDTPAGLAVIAEALRRCHDAVIAPHWDRMRALLDADITYRARRLSDTGVAVMVGELHRDVQWAEGEVVLAREPFERTVTIGGHGLVLCPSVFAWPYVTAALRPTGAGTLRYPARGAGTLWEPPRPETNDHLVRLLGPTRAALLAGLAQPATTPELAGRLGVTPGAVSQHLAVLRLAGLVTTQRDGRNAVHLRTRRADALLADD
jgi:DNA-binding transcriptional ArsR family regulator